MKVYGIRTFTGSNYMPNLRQSAQKQTVSSHADFSFATNVFDFKPLSKEQIFANNNIEFKGKPCSPSSFEVKKAFGINCPCCGQVMLTKKQQKAFAARIEVKRGDGLRKELRKELGYFRPFEREIADIYIQKSKEYPDLDIVGLTEVLADEGIARLVDEQKTVFDKLEKAAEKLSPDIQEEILDVIDNARIKIETSTDESHFKRQNFIKEIISVRDKYQDTSDEFKEIEEIACTLPTTHTSKDAFFVKYSRKKASEIANRLVIPAIATTEHIQPQSLHGENNTDNYIPLCEECNSRRGNMPYNEWFELHPEMPENLQEYINTVSKMIDAGEFNGYEYYDTYVDEIIRAINIATGGELILKYPEKEVAEEKKTEEEAVDDDLETIEDEREYLLSLYNLRLRSMSRLYDLKKKFQGDKEYKDIVAYVRLEREIQGIKVARNQKEAALAVKRRKFNRMGEKITEVQTGRRTSKYSLKELHAAHEKYRMEVQEGKKVIEPYDIKLEELTAELKELRKKITLPCTIQQRVIKMRNRLSEINSVQKEINRLKTIIKEKGQEATAKDKSDKTRPARELLSIAQQKLKQLLGGKTQIALEQEYEILNRRKKEIQEKFDHTDIEGEIKALEAECCEIIQKFTDSFEAEYDYQHSNSKLDIDAASSSSSS